MNDPSSGPYCPSRHRSENQRWKERQAFGPCQRTKNAIKYEGDGDTKELEIGERVECPRGVMIKAMDCGIIVSEFVLQSRYYVHFRANTLGKGMNPLIPPAMG